MYFWNFFIEEKVVNIIKSDEVVYVVSDSVGETAEFVVKSSRCTIQWWEC